MITPEMINTFLNVYQYGNISAAAIHTYASQSNMSKQIKLLEEELGVVLLIRKKGHSSVTLTPHGEEFLRLAKQWQSLMQGMQQVKELDQIATVSIGALDRMNTFVLKAFYQNVLETHQNIRLDIHTSHSREIYEMMRNKQVDIGFVSGLLPVSDIDIFPLYTQTMVVVYSQDMNLGDVVDPADLDPEKEIYSYWSDEYDIWHDQLWPGKKYHIHVGTVSMIVDYLEVPGRWTIMPMDALQSLLAHRSLKYARLSVDTPETTIYMLTSQTVSPNRQEAIDLIKQELLDYFKNKQEADRI